MATLKVFISYRRDDGFAAATVPRLYERLCERYGAENVFMDVDTIPPGVDFANHLSEAVAQSNVLLAVMGRDWAKFIQERADDEDDFVRIEIESALERRIPVVPLLVGNATMPKSADLPPSIAPFSRRNGVLIDLARDFNAHVNRLADDLDRHYGEGATVAESTLEPVETREVVEEEADASSFDDDFDIGEVEDEMQEPEKPGDGGDPSDEDFDIAELEDETEERGDSVDSSHLDFDIPVLEDETQEPQPAVESDGIVNVPEFEESSDEIASEEIKPAFGSEAPKTSMPSVTSEARVLVDAANLPREQLIDLGQGVQMPFCFIPAGCFGRNGYTVTLTTDFWMAKYPVTQREWTAIMGSNPSHFKGNILTGKKSNHPVERVNWIDAGLFCKKTGLRLPTKAEWEYACRAGTTGDFNLEGATLDELGWYDENSGKTTHPVGEKKPNAWGLHDMHGNVWEWCQNWYSHNDYYPQQDLTDPTGPEKQTQTPDRVTRGGSWACPARLCQSELSSSHWRPDLGNKSVGFRPVRSA